MECSRTKVFNNSQGSGSNNTNKWNAQELVVQQDMNIVRSNNTNKWNAQELIPGLSKHTYRSNNTNKWNAQELW